jgi:glycosyltransferase involved in cell wall biosynthesis
MLRVLHCVGSLGCGGIQKTLVDIYRYADKNKIQFDFLVEGEKEGIYEKEVLSLGGRIYRVTPRRKSVIKHRKDLYRFFREHKEYSIVHVHVSSLSNIQVLIVATKNNIRTRIIHGRNSAGPAGILHYCLHYINRLRFNQYVTHRFAVSDLAGQWVFGKNAEYKVLRNTLDCERYRYNPKTRQRIRDEMGLSDKFVIGHIGRFHRQKNHIFLLQVFAEVYKADRDARLLLLGDGELREVIIGEAEKLGINEAILMLGVRFDVPDLLQAMDMFLFPSLFEGFGNVLAEAQAAGLRCIASDVMPKLTKITDLINYISLDEPPARWAQEVLQYRNGYDRRDTMQEMIDAGFDNKGNIEWLIDFYARNSAEG